MTALIQLPRGFLIGCLALLPAGLSGAEPAVDASQLPRIPATPPAQALSTFRIKPGFRLQLVAAEPLVVDPIALSFDEDGRAFVVEMRDYSERRPERLGRIRRLVDADGDGRFDRGTNFAQDLPWPTAVICYGGGVFVGCTPDILWMRDTDGDGVADEREAVFTGFAADSAPFATNKLNVQALVNSFNWSLDNRIHGATSFSAGKVRLVDSPFVRRWREEGGPPGKKTRAPRLNSATDSTIFERVLDLRGRDFSFDPRALEMRAESGGGQHGMSFGNDGRKFVCANSSHIQAILYEERYATANSGYVMPRALMDIAVDGGAAPVFRLSPDEPWRVLRTQWRVAGLVPGPVEGGGRASGYFTGATGLTIYRGDAYGESFVGDAFVGDAGGNLVHRKKVIAEGASLKAQRPGDEATVEFLASTDNWFRPVQFANAPDGCLYICDMYREVIEHPWSLPASLKRHLDLNSGNDRGRLYRVVPEKFRQPALPRLGRATTRTLVATLESRNGWSRDAAARLLYERQDPAAVAGLRRLLNRASDPVTRLHALASLAGTRNFRDEDALGGLRDASSMVRGEALRRAEPLLTRSGGAGRLSEAVRSMAVETNAVVRQQLGFSIRFLSRELRAETAAALLGNRPPGEDNFSLLSSISGEAWEIFKAMAARDPSLSHPGLGGLAGLVGMRHQATEVTGLVDVVASAEVNPARIGACITMVDSLALGLELGGRSLGEFDPNRRLAPLFSGARARVADLSATAVDGSQPSRMVELSRAISLLGAAPGDESLATLLALVGGPTALAREAVTALDRRPGLESARALLERWPQLTPQIRGLAVAMVVKRVERAWLLLEAIEHGQVKGSELSVVQRTQLREHRNGNLREKASQILGGVSPASRQTVVDSYRASLSLKGSQTAGRAIFQARCATCHRLGSEGIAVGPDLVTVKNGGVEKLLSNILDPNREMNGNYLSYAIETRDGESLVGIITGESASGVTLRQPGGAESRMARSRIANLQAQERSLMPEGLEEGMSQQDMANLLEFIMASP